MDKLQLQRLRDLPIEGVAERLGLSVVRHKSLCPFHEDKHPSLSFYVRKNTFRCFVCGAHGDTIDLVMRHLGLPFRDACRWLADGSLSFTQPVRKGAEYQDKEKAATFDPSRYIRFFEHPWLMDEARQFLFQERRLNPRVVEWCRLTSWRDRHGTPWLQTPYYDMEGKLIGVQNRNLDYTRAVPQGDGGDTPRFRFPAGSRCSIYNLPILRYLRPGDSLWITEGCSDCWAMLSSGHKAIAIPSATLLSARDKELLSSLSSRASPGYIEGLTFHMYPDRDSPGEHLFLQLREVLPELRHHQLPPDCKDYSDLYIKNLNHQRV